MCYAPKELAPQMSDLVRVGRNADGGYLLPRQVLADIKGCLSFGLGAEWSFEQALLALNQGTILPKDIVFFDASISMQSLGKSIFDMFGRTVAEIRQAKRRSERKYRLGDFKRVLIALVIYLPTFKIRKRRFKLIEKFVVSRVSKENEISFIDALSYRSDPKRVIVKIDIEGGEWDLLRGKEDIDLLADVPVLIMEIHDTRKDQFMEIVEMLKHYFWIAHLHGNTSDRCVESGMPLYLEMTFVNKRFKPELGIRKKLPIDGLDFPSRPGEAPYEFVFNNA